MDITSYIMGSIAGAKSASGLKYLVVDELPETGADNTIYLVPKSTSKTNNYYDEYMYISNAWELIGDTEIDLSNYVQKTDYATSSTGGVIKTGSYALGINSSGNLYAGVRSYSDYNSDNTNTFISKGTLENVIEGKGLITQYSTMPTANEDNLGKIVQYTGTTTQDYTNGYFYQCVSDGEETPTYSWSNINTQATGEVQYITDGDGNRIFFMNFQRDNSQTYRENVVNKIAQYLVDDYEAKGKGKSCVINIGDSDSYDINRKDGIFYISARNKYSSNYQYKLSGLSFSTFVSIPSTGIYSYDVFRKSKNSGYINTDLNKIVTGMTMGQSGDFDINVLQPNKNYSTPYTPQYAGSPATKKYVDDNVATAITQYSTIPTASASTVGKIIQYTGATNNNYTNGYFYQCVSDGSTYSWNNINIQDSNSSTDVQINGTSIVSSGVANILTNTAYSSSNKIATMSDISTAIGTALQGNY